ncbi:MAG: aminotransferase class V-fold PLP-dependent enzyme [Bacteroidia bacterium]|nr:MAG: aminotransferase class V-fold PLP-dependent enzyme [Bacteroidia bacterium]
MQKEFKDLFYIKEGLTFLNAGSFGACPKPILKKYQELQIEFEQDPVQFYTVTGPAYLNESRKVLGKYLNTQEDNLVYVTNPSYAVNIVAKSFPLQKDDEVLATSLEYGACDRTWKYYCLQKGAHYIQQPITLPIASKEDFISDFVKGISTRTKLIFISHITSSTALKLPVEEICKIANEKGIPVFIDGAHAPGQTALNLDTLGASFYTGACHKWMLTPKGSAFLFAVPEWQNILDPLTISWGYHSDTPSHSQFIDYHQMQGTRDFSAFLTVPFAIDFLNQYQWETISAGCRQLVQQNAPRFLELMDRQALAPLNDDFILQLFSIPIVTDDAMALHDLFYKQYQIQIPISTLGNQHFIRYSIQAFNTQNDLDRLYEAMVELKEKKVIR